MPIVILLLLLLVAVPSKAQISIVAESQVTVSDGDHAPLWLQANRYGLGSIQPSSGYFRVAGAHTQKFDSTRHVVLQAKADIAVASDFTSTVIVQQLYGEISYGHALLTIGSKQQPMELKNAALSTGSQTLGINARPLPEVRISLPDYWDVPLTRHWVAMKGHIAYGMQTDDGWQRRFTHRQKKRTEHALRHTKAGYLRIGKPEGHITTELGLEMACQFGGTTFMPDDKSQIIEIAHEGGLKGALRAFIPGGGDAGEGIYKNKNGNHLGSYLARLSADYDSWGLSLYADHYFEDHSQMFFIDYDGYGSGADFNHWSHNRWVIYDLRDIMLGIELRLPRFRPVHTIVAEHLSTKYQSGPIYHDRTPNVSDHIGGRDDYYNHMYHTGWQHWGQVSGNPLYLSPIYNTDGTIYVTNNRFTAWHIGLAGSPLRHLDYRLMATFQHSLGSFTAPLPEPDHSISLLAETTKTFAESSPLRSWTVRAAVGLDRGDVRGNNFGCQLTLTRRIK